ncbi:MAG TPA: site-specific integrase [Acidimicrobiales bacterium]|nr:site-specific integrase [Acidimicrobiales bacterium]
MRGHLESRGKNVWRAKVYLGREEGNTKRYLQRTIHGSKRQAEDVMNEMLVEAGRSSTAIVDGSFRDLSEKWLGLASQTLSPTTLHEYERLLDRLILPQFGDRKVRTISAADLDSFYAFLGRRGGQDGKPLGAQSVRHVHALIRRLLNQAVKWNWIPTNPAGKASPPRLLPRNLEIPTPQALVDVLHLADERNPELGCFLHLAAVTGARRGELCALRWTDFDRGSLQISRSVYGSRQDELREKGTKTHAVRRVSLDPQSVDRLAELRKSSRQQARSCGVVLSEDAFVFSDDPDGSRPWRPGRVTLAFRRLCDEVGVPTVRLHDLRHFAATQLLAAGVPVRTVAGRLGHANAATTLNVYAHVLESSDEEAAGVLGRLLANDSRDTRP